MTLDEVYEDDDIEAVAEWWMTDAAVQIATGTKRRHEWRRERVYRDLEDEGVTAMLDRYRGALLGLAAGDALGTTLAFSAPGTFTPIDEYGWRGSIQSEAR
jgi:hypothetical protein